MALDTTMFDTDLAFMVTDLGETMTFSGSDYACVAGAVRKARRDEMPGFFNDADFEIVVQTSLISGTRPDAGDKVTVNSVEYRITAATTDEADTALILACEEVTA